MHIISFFSRQTDAFIIRDYLPSKIEIKLQMSLRQVPILWLSPQIIVNEPDQNLRDRISLNLSRSKYTGFEHFVRTMLFDLLPTCYLEGYESILNQVKNLPWPDSPKFIFTSNSFDSDEVFKLYAAEKSEQGTPYYIGQHGNNYGTYKFNYSETECVENSDKFLTWGWTDGRSKCIPAFNFKMVGLSHISWDEKGGLLLVEVCLPHGIETWDVNSEFEKYQNDQFIFVKNLPKMIQQALTVRLHPSFLRYKWFENLRWKDKSPFIKIEYGYAKILNLISKSRLVVFSYDSTGLLETLYLNIPTICFWSGGLSHLRDNAKPYYIKLQEVGILHYSPESAARKVTEIWEDVMAWWNGDIVQSSRSEFCERFSRKSENPVKHLKKLLIEKGS
jgi:putative transferase (TIGR04331 family)